MKEARALLPVWGATVLAMIVATQIESRHQLLGIPFPDALPISVYWIGAIGLGAFSIGHEYSYRTLATLLAQPVRRIRIVLTKLVILAVFSLALAAVAAVVVFDRGNALFQFDPNSSRG